MSLALMVSLRSLLWAHAAVMAIQIAEKSLVGRGFDDVVRRRILPAYDRSLFRRHHAMWFSTLIALLILFETMGTGWLTLVLSVGTLAATQSLVLLGISVAWREYVPGTVSGLGFVGLQALVLGLPADTRGFDLHTYAVAAAIGVTLAVGTLGCVLFMRVSAREG
jgi:hypothetical protein